MVLGRLELCDDEEMKTKLINKEKEVEERKLEIERRKREFGDFTDPKATNTTYSNASTMLDGSSWTSGNAPRLRDSSFVGQLGRQGSRRRFVVHTLISKVSKLVFSTFF